jgi:hypothetical protein
MATAAMTEDEELAALEVERIQAEIDYSEELQALKLKLVEAKKARIQARHAAQQISLASRATAPEATRQRPLKIEPQVKIERISLLSDDDGKPLVSTSRKHSRAADATATATSGARENPLLRRVRRDLVQVTTHGLHQAVEEMDEIPDSDEHEQDSQDVQLGYPEGYLAVQVS